MESKKQVNAMTDQNNSTVWVDGETGDDKQQQCEAQGTLTEVGQWKSEAGSETAHNLRK